MPAPDGTAAATYAVDARHSGASTSRLSSEPVVRWRHRWDHGTGGSTVFGAVSSGDVVVAAVDRQIDYVPTVEVAAFDRSTGASRWTVHLSGQSMPHLAVAGGRVFVTSTDNPLTGLPGTVRALDIGTGAVLWVERPPNAHHLNSVPVAAGTDLYVTSGTGRSGQVHALDQGTGLVRWTRTATDIGGVDGVSPTVAGNALVVGQGCAVWSLRRSDGAQLWQSVLNPCGNPVHGIVADSARAYVAGGGDEGGRTVDLATGTVVGSFPAGKDPVVNADTVYTDTWEAIEARDKSTGALRWRHQLGGSTSDTNVVVIGPHLFHLDLFNGQLVGLSTATGEPTLQVPLGQADTGTPGPMNAGNGVVLVSYGSELVVVS
jgi:outer membrane protein assembly factor BamB